MKRYRFNNDINTLVENLYDKYEDLDIYESILLHAYADYSNRYGWATNSFAPSYDELYKLGAKMSKRKYYEVRKSLVEQGFIWITKKPYENGKTYNYVIHWNKKYYAQKP